MMSLVSAAGCLAAMECLATVGPTLGTNLCCSVYHLSSGPMELKQDNKLSNICRFHLLTPPGYKHGSHKEYTKWGTHIKTQERTL